MKHHRTTPTPPEAWLVVNRGCALGAFPSAFDPALRALLKKEKDRGFVVEVVRDDPSLDVTHNGLHIENPSWLTARDNWFERYWGILEKVLRDPRQALVYTFAPGRLTDPLGTQKSSRQGPFPFPQGKPWPRCGFCTHQLAFVGVLDFRSGHVPQAPRASLVLHFCTECVCSNREAWSVTWIKEDEPIEILGDSSKETLVGTPWLVTEYPLPGSVVASEDLVKRGPFLAEQSIFFNFSCFADKVGGRVFWIHSGEDLFDENSFVSEEGEPMMYIGQFIGSPDFEIGDGGIAYLLYSPRTGETIMYPQWF